MEERPRAQSTLHLRPHRTNKLLQGLSQFKGIIRFSGRKTARDDRDVERFPYPSQMSPMHSNTLTKPFMSQPHLGLERALKSAQHDSEMSKLSGSSERSPSSDSDENSQHRKPSINQDFPLRSHPRSSRSSKSSDRPSLPQQQQRAHSPPHSEKPVQSPGSAGGGDTGSGKVIDGLPPVMDPKNHPFSASSLSSAEGAPSTASAAKDNSPSFPKAQPILSPTDNKRPSGQRRPSTAASTTSNATTVKAPGGPLLKLKRSFSQLRLNSFSKQHQPTDVTTSPSPSLGQHHHQQQRPPPVPSPHHTGSSSSARRPTSPKSASSASPTGTPVRVTKNSASASSPSVAAASASTAQPKLTPSSTTPLPPHPNYPNMTASGPLAPMSLPKSSPSTSTSTSTSRRVAPSGQPPKLILPPVNHRLSLTIASSPGANGAMSIDTGSARFSPTVISRPMPLPILNLPKLTPRGDSLKTPLGSTSTSTTPGASGIANNRGGGGSGLVSSSSKGVTTQQKGRMGIGMGIGSSRKDEERRVGKQHLKHMPALPRQGTSRGTRGHEEVDDMEDDDDFSGDEDDYEGEEGDEEFDDEGDSSRIMGDSSFSSIASGETVDSRVLPRSGERERERGKERERTPSSSSSYHSALEGITTTNPNPNPNSNQGYGYVGLGVGSVPLLKQPTPPRVGSSSSSASTYQFHASGSSSHSPGHHASASRQGQSSHNKNSSLYNTSLPEVDTSRIEISFLPSNDTPNPNSNDSSPSPSVDTPATVTPASPNTPVALINHDVKGKGKARDLGSSSLASAVNTTTGSTGSASWASGSGSGSGSGAIVTGGPNVLSHSGAGVGGRPGLGLGLGLEYDPSKTPTTTSVGSATISGPIQTSSYYYYSGGGEGEGGRGRGREGEGSGNGNGQGTRGWLNAPQERLYLLPPSSGSSSSEQAQPQAQAQAQAQGVSAMSSTTTETRAQSPTGTVRQVPFGTVGSESGSGGGDYFSSKGFGPGYPLGGSDIGGAGSSTGVGSGIRTGGATTGPRPASVAYYHLPSRHHHQQHYNHHHQVSPLPLPHPSSPSSIPTPTPTATSPSIANTSVPANAGAGAGQSRTPNFRHSVALSPSPSQIQTPRLGGSGMRLFNANGMPMPRRSSTLMVSPQLGYGSHGQGQGQDVWGMATPAIGAGLDTGRGIGALGGMGGGGGAAGQVFQMPKMYKRASQSLIDLHTLEAKERKRMLEEEVRVEEEKELVKLRELERRGTEKKKKRESLVSATGVVVVKEKEKRRSRIEDEKIKEDDDDDLAPVAPAATGIDEVEEENEKRDQLGAPTPITPTLTTTMHVDLIGGGRVPIGDNEAPPAFSSIAPHSSSGAGTTAAAAATKKQNRLSATPHHLRRRRSMPMYDESSLPPPYPSFLPQPQTKYRIMPREDEGSERLPPYTNPIYLKAIMPRKMEFTSPGVQAKDRKWKRMMCVLDGTVLRVYKCPPGHAGVGVIGEWWENKVGAGDVSLQPSHMGAVSQVKIETRESRRQEEERRDLERQIRRIVKSEGGTMEDPAASQVDLGGGVGGAGDPGAGYEDDGEPDVVFVPAPAVLVPDDNASDRAPSRLRTHSSASLLPPSTSSMSQSYSSSSSRSRFAQFLKPGSRHHSRSKSEATPHASERNTPNPSPRPSLNIPRDGSGRTTPSTSAGMGGGARSPSPYLSAGGNELRTHTPMSSSSLSITAVDSIMSSTALMGRSETPTSSSTFSSSRMQQQQAQAHSAQQQQQLQQQQRQRQLQQYKYLYTNRERDFLPDPDPADLVKEYTLQHAESGIGNDYSKRKNVIRLRLEGEQFLLQARDVTGVVEWIEALQAATNIALDLDERPMPRGPLFPRRRRRRRPQIGATSSGGQDGGQAASSTLVTDQPMVVAAM